MVSKEKQHCCLHTANWKPGGLKRPGDRWVRFACSVCGRFLGYLPPTMVDGDKTLAKKGGGNV